ncbi:mycofactocin biosynthesis chaperone MftB [Mycolicibacterium sp. CH28]|uniref:mycofactocin biosynthesis chaperone MftB n=1 Tax=Mycolicibacterium sp. CH28 TaxID=2512237 RepID=UPI001080236C|nr:mycofactocin biosynthesis chaperone MftB [Mycolicibacterium sp. CH28]TGD86673.1 mycofactocin biosynthesis chaperone MftB [Mycolicibacterium sp. CH28]
MTARVFDANCGWELDPQVRVRQEQFGVLLYHFGNRRLTFVKDPALAAVVSELDGTSTVAARCERAGITLGHKAVDAALAALEAGGMIRRARQ